MYIVFFHKYTKFKFILFSQKSHDFKGVQERYNEVTLAYIPDNLQFQ